MIYHHAVDYVDYDSDCEVRADPDRAVTDVDPYSGVDKFYIIMPAVSDRITGIFFSKDRREEVIEIEEEPEVVFIPEANEQVKLMTQSQWMKGCPEGGEQSFLFSLYSQLSGGEYMFPCECGSSITRKKYDFFAMFVSVLATVPVL
jgi:hypothetical protein